MIADPAGAAADPSRVAAVTDPGFWAGQPAALAEALGSNPDAPIAEHTPGSGHGAWPAPTSVPGRLTLTVQEAAGLLGISRAFAYEAVRRGEIPDLLT